MNKGTYGYPLPPNAPTRVAPPEWKNHKLFLASSSAEIVPQNVYQVMFLVWGAGGSAWNYMLGGSYSEGGGGGGFACAILDVVPGQLLPPITVGTAAGSSSSVGSLITATGGGNGASNTIGTGGTGSVSGSLRGARTASGGNGQQSGSTTYASGGSAGFITGNGVTGGYLGGATPLASMFYSKANSAVASSSGYSYASSGDNPRSTKTLIEMLFSPMPGDEGGDLSVVNMSAGSIGYAGNGGVFAKGGSIVGQPANSSASVYAGNGGFGAPGGGLVVASGLTAQSNGAGGFGAPAGVIGGHTGNTGIVYAPAGFAAGAGAGYSNKGTHGQGCVIMLWTEGY